MPDGVPIRVGLSAIVAELGIVFGSSRVGAEEHPIAIIIEGIQDNCKHIGVKGSEVPGHVVDHHSFGSLGIKAPNANIEELIIVEDSHLGGFASRFARVGILLNEITDGLGQLPLGLIQDPIDHKGLLDPGGGDSLFLVGAGRIELRPKSEGRRTAHHNPTQDLWPSVHE